jgi:hypothetical protein
LFLSEVGEEGWILPALIGCPRSIGIQGIFKDVFLFSLLRQLLLLFCSSSFLVFWNGTVVSYLLSVFTAAPGLDSLVEGIVERVPRHT